MDKDIDIISNVEVNKKATGLAEGDVEVIVSNSGLDRHGERIMVDGIELKRIRQNPVLLWLHDHWSLPIGKILKLWMDGKNLKARVHIDFDLGEFENLIYQKILRGSLNAVSIGGLVLERDAKDDNKITKLEMIELSFCPIGAHPDALVTNKALEAEGLSKEIYQDFVRRSLNKKFTGLKKDSLTEYIETLKTLTSALESTYTETTKETDSKVELKPVKKLVVLRSVAKQCDKQSELVISAINNKIKEL